ncbi:MAG: 2-hydroxychromene-2-carboxylate isomerase [Burkholderiales bacterium]
MTSAEWYFDFISPFAYLQFESLGQLPAELSIEFRPVVFAGILNHLKHKGPAEIPGKRRFTYRHVQWLARHHGIPLKFPPAHPFNPLRALRLAVALENTREAIATIFRFIWRDGRTLDDPREWQALTTELNVADADTRIAAQPVKDALRANSERAAALGVFGVPTFALDGELFWGFDATGMVSDYLRAPQWFKSPDMARLDNLPAAASRV